MTNYNQIANSPSAASALVSTDIVILNNPDVPTQVKATTLASLSDYVRQYNQGNRLVNVTSSTVTLSVATHSGKVVTLNRAAGIAVTLPAATGSGASFTLIIGTTITSNSTTIVTAGTDKMGGVAIISSDDAGDVCKSFEAAIASITTITMNGTTKGGIAGDRIILTDIASGQWAVEMIAQATGTEVTPFS